MIILYSWVHIMIIWWSSEYHVMIIWWSSNYHLWLIIIRIVSVVDHYVSMLWSCDNRSMIIIINKQTNKQTNKQYLMIHWWLSMEHLKIILLLSYMIIWLSSKEHLRSTWLTLEDYLLINIWSYDDSMIIIWLTFDDNFIYI